MTRIKVSPNNKTKELNQILEISGENILNCMQCGKCSASCPAGSEMDILPHQVVRLLQIGSIEKILNSSSIWNCASCFTCGERCPRNVDISKLMESIRLTIIRKKGSSVLKVDDIPMKIDEKTPQQAIVSGFRKYNK